SSSVFTLARVVRFTASSRAYFFTGGFLIMRSWSGASTSLVTGFGSSCTGLTAFTGSTFQP
ncbi:MAG: hypothetical protein KKF43_17915, partial [Proteobacteria bacterium]|nr:hypothetical protein [Pseudomonadota bacterium]